MFDLLFGWRKASKCKKLIRHVQCRLKFLKIKKGSIVRQSRDDIAQLLKNGQNKQAFSRVEQLFKDQNLLAAYDLLDHFCEFIIIHFTYIRKHKDCPNDINEAVSTLIYAAAWCGDLPELKKIQKLFGERYGHKFAKAAVELYHGTLVNCQMREKLGRKSIPENVTLRLMDEIAKEYGLLHLPEFCGTSDCQLGGSIVQGDAQVNYKSISGAQTPAPNHAELKVEPLQVTAMPRSTNFECSYEPKTIPSMLLGQSSLESCGSNKLSIVALENMVEMGNTKRASDISFQFQESVDNFDEVKEFQFRTIQDLCDEDKRTFLFNSSIFQLPDSYIFGGESLLFLSSYGCDEIDNDKNGSWNWTCSRKRKVDNRKSYCRYRSSRDVDTNCYLEHPCYYNVNCSCSIGSSPQVEAEIEAQASYSRTKTGSPEKLNGTTTVNNSSESQLIASAGHSHIHPKLPDYDELAAKFLALKKEHQRRVATGSGSLNVRQE